MSATIEYHKKNDFDFLVEFYAYIYHPVHDRGFTCRVNTRGTDGKLLDMVLFYCCVPVMILCITEAAKQRAQEYKDTYKIPVYLVYQKELKKANRDILKVLKYFGKYKVHKTMFRTLFYRYKRYGTPFNTDFISFIVTRTIQNRPIRDYSRWLKAIKGVSGRVPEGFKYLLDMDT